MTEVRGLADIPLVSPEGRPDVGSLISVGGARSSSALAVMDSSPRRFPWAPFVIQGMAGGFKG
jgi:hypothetical protein